MNALHCRMADVLHTELENLTKISVYNFMMALSDLGKLVVRGPRIKSVAKFGVFWRKWDFHTFQKVTFLDFSQKNGAFHNIVIWKRCFVCYCLKNFQKNNKLRLSASVFWTKSTNHWVFPDFDIMKGSISLPKVIKVSFWEVWNSPFTWKNTWICNTIYYWIPHI